MKKIIFVALLLSSCANPLTPSPKFVHVCPTVKPYSLSFEKSVAEQLKNLSPGSPLAQMISDYAALRKAARDCLGQ
jgi:hypothetical protein